MKQKESSENETRQHDCQGGPEILTALQVARNAGMLSLLLLPLPQLESPTKDVTPCHKREDCELVFRLFEDPEFDMGYPLDGARIVDYRDITWLHYYPCCQEKVLLLLDGNQHIIVVEWETYWFYN